MPTNEFVADLLADYGPARLGGSSEFAPNFNEQEIRLFDVMLDPDVSQVWSLFYLPPLGQQAAVAVDRDRLVPLSHDVAGRLLLGAGGAANQEIEFDWSTGGVIVVPASNVQLNAHYDPFDPAAQRIAPAGRFQAWVVPGASGGARGRNYCTRRVVNPPIVPASVVTQIPLTAKRVQIYGLNNSGGVLGIVVSVLDAGGSPLANFTVNVGPASATTPQSVIQMEPYWLPRGASVLAFGVGGILGNIGIVTLVYELGI